MQKPSRTTALCYARKSVVRGGADLVSIDIQRAAIAAECERRGWNCEWYEDADGHRSGRHEATRPNWLRLKRRIADADVIAVVGYRLDRLSRSVGDFVRLIEHCRAKNVGVVTADRMIDTSASSNAFATAQLNMLAVVAQFESDAASDRVKEHCERKAEAGISHGKPPFGVSRVGKALEATFDANEDAPAVLRCLQLYAGGLSYDQTAAKLNAEGVPFRSRKGFPIEWGRESVRTVVGNVLFYVGYFAPAWDAKNARVTLAGDGDHVERFARATLAKPSPAIHPIIDRQLANTVIERRAANLITGRKSVRPFLFTPIAYWNGKKLRGQHHPTGRFYSPRGAGPWINADEAEESLLKLLAGIQFPPELVAHVRAFALADVSDDKLQRLQERISEVQNTKALLFDLLHHKRIDRAMYDERWAKADADERAAKRELERPAEVEVVMKQLADLGAMIQFMPPEMQKRNIHRLFTRIDFDDDGEIVGLEMKPAAKSAFGTIAAAMPTLPKVGVEPTLLSLGTRF